MTYKINNTELTLQPTSGRWIPRSLLGTAGSSHSVYSGVRNYELTWGLLSPAEFNQLIGFYNTLGVSGTVSVDLPEYGASTYTFKTYSGCTMQEPETGAYFTEHQQSARLLITSIRA